MCFGLFAKTIRHRIYDMDPKSEGWWGQWGGTEQRRDRQWLQQSRGTWWFQQSTYMRVASWLTASRSGAFGWPGFSLCCLTSLLNGASPPSTCQMGTQERDCLCWVGGLGKQYIHWMDGSKWTLVLLNVLLLSTAGRTQHELLLILAVEYKNIITLIQLLWALILILMSDGCCGCTSVTACKPIQPLIKCSVCRWLRLEPLLRFIGSRLWRNASCGWPVTSVLRGQKIRQLPYSDMIIICFQSAFLMLISSSTLFFLARELNNTNR